MLSQSNFREFLPRCQSGFKCRCRAAAPGTAGAKGSLTKPRWGGLTEPLMPSTSRVCVLLTWF